MSLPPSSPRLPSPPPPTEIQIGPQSPALGISSSTEPPVEEGVLEANATRRIHPGTKAADMAAGPPLVPLGEVRIIGNYVHLTLLTIRQLDSAFQLQEHLKALHYHHTKSEDGETTIPISRQTASIIATRPEGVDRSLWLYELCRFLINKCNDLIIGFLFDDPPCSASTCPEMRASEWQFLCAVHEPPKSCCAIDYCCHTLDWATNIVTSQKIFPSRLTLEGGTALDSRGSSEKHLTNIFRRLHRIFAHAWFQHRGVFWQVEGHTGLYVFFKRICDTYDLLPAEAYKLPPEAEGLETASDSRPPPPTLLKPTKTTSLLGRSNAAEEDFSNIPPTHTRRHIRGAPSVGAAVATVLEAEDEETDVTQKLQQMELQDDNSVLEIPVIVETSDDQEGASEPVFEQATEPAEESKQTEVSLEDPEDPEDQRPKTAYLDKGFPEVLDENESTAGTQETLVEEKVDKKMQSDERDAPVSEIKPDVKEATEIIQKDEKDEKEKGNQDVVKDS